MRTEFISGCKNKLPRKTYFLKIINRLRGQKHNVFLSVFRVVAYREGIRLYGSSYMEDIFIGLLSRLKGLGLATYIFLQKTRLQCL